MATNSVSTSVQRGRPQPTSRRERRSPQPSLSTVFDHYDSHALAVPKIGEIATPASNELAADRRRLETEERRERDRLRELELARARELARFD